MDKEIQNKLAWLILSIVTVLFIVGLYLYIQPSSREIISTTINEEITTTNNSTSSPAITASSPDPSLLKRLTTIYGTNNTYNVIGSSKPKITIVEFGDFTCIHCRASYPVIRSLTLKYQDSVQLIFRDRTPTEKSLGLALGAHCAGEQNQFWPMHDLLYQYQSDSLGQDEASILTLAQKLNLDQSQFKNCLDNRKYLNTIKKNMVDSERLAVEGTPSWFVNGIAYPSGELNKIDFENYLLNLLN